MHVCKKEATEKQYTDSVAPRGYTCRDLSQQ